MSETSSGFTIGDVTFDSVDYAEYPDELHFWRGPRRPAADIDETPEGHHVRFDAAGEICQFFIHNARVLLDHDGAIHVTLPPNGPTTVLDRETLETLLVDPAPERWGLTRSERVRWRLAPFRDLARRLSPSAAVSPRPSSPRRPRPPASRSVRRP
ncbi:hypothetical protein [Conexibacter woesei]|uniref:Uncharacterized protein n=1 Tax=Conexibacter woesei (strain DSM 14684 / CCUG 47730 / CIP 108061 / JCM 11494 / NBRC 100937 / ID131577) TaxID=469383 RepID=D3F0J2_CONWI|nr:hypothetical protein [Conexibacter woesei]ADB53926.1 hypothetical protein Cwoe_5521 [Conexibacter woesei DSM 14684]